WLSALAGRAPSLLVVEDLHWADPSTLELLHLLTTRAPASLLTVATTRDSAVVPDPEGADLIELGRLDDEAALRIVDNLTSGQELPAESREEIVEQAQGNPLFVEELTRACVTENRTEPMPLRLQE